MPNMEGSLKRAMKRSPDQVIDKLYNESMQVVKDKIALVDDLYIKQNVEKYEIRTDLDNLIWRKEGEENRQQNINKNEEWVHMKNEEAAIKA